MFQIPEKIEVSFTSSNGKWIDILSPNDDRHLTLVQIATEKDLHTLLEMTKKIQERVSQLKPFERARILRKAASELERQHEFLAFVIASEGGKPLKDARIEVGRAISTLELCAEETLRLPGEVIPMERTAEGKDHLAFTIRDPIGPVLAISAFNHPLNLIAHQAGCAFASGCSVVLKPASATPISAYFLLKAFEAAGIPSGALRVVNTEVSLVSKLVSSTEFAFLSFVGSAKVGWELRKQISPGTRIALEHGGQAPAIVRADAEISKAVVSLLKGAFYHAGQVCISTQGIFVHHSRFDEFVTRFKAAASNLITGSATNEETDVGPLIRPSEVERLLKWIKEAESAGANVALGNKVSGLKNQFLNPTILLNVPRECSLMKEEAFGPVVCINSYQNEEELLHFLNEKDYIFEAALFTQDISKAMRIATDMASMTVVINNHTAFRVDQMPFGGHKKAGLGIGGVKYAIEELTRIKQIIIKY